MGDLSQEEIVKIIDIFSKYCETIKDQIVQRAYKNHIVLDFNDIIGFDATLGHFILDYPEDTLKVFNLELPKFLMSTVPEFEVRIKNVKNYIKISNVRVRTHSDKMITVRGVIKLRGSLIGDHAPVVKFGCPSCNNDIPVLQIKQYEHPIKSDMRYPTRCSCGFLAKNEKQWRITEPIIENIYAIGLEEEIQDTGGQTPKAIDVICRKDLSDPSVENQLLQGTIVEVTGVLKHYFEKKQNSKLSTEVRWYLDANYIRVVDDNFRNIRISKKEEDSFIEFAKQPDVLEIIRDSIFYNIVKCGVETMVVTLQLFGGVTIHKPGSPLKRGILHVLLLGDSSGGKSAIIKLAQMYSPRSMYVTGGSVSGPGLTASVVVNEFTGRRDLLYGALPLCSGGMVCIDEFDKVPDDHKKSLLTPMAHLECSITKAGVMGRQIPAETAVLAGANPPTGSYSDMGRVEDQFKIPQELLTRFDFVFPMKLVDYTEEDRDNINRHIFQRGAYDNPPPNAKPMEFIKKYIWYCRHYINPIIPKHLIDKAVETTSKLQRNSEESLKQGNSAYRVTFRATEAFSRLYESVARARMHPEVTEADMNFANDLMAEAYKKRGIDAETGDYFQEIVVDGVVKKSKMLKKDISTRIMALVRNYEAEHNEPMLIDEIAAILINEGAITEEIPTAFDLVRKDGSLYEKKPGRLGIPSGGGGYGFRLGGKKYD